MEFSEHFDYNNDLNTLQRLLILLSIVSFSLLVFGLISAIFITRRMYSPLQDLMDQAVFAASGSSNEEKPKSMNHNEYDLISFSLRMLAAHSSELENRVENSAPLLKEALLRKLLFHTYVKQDLEFVRQLELYGSTEYRVILCTPDRLWSIPDPHKALFLYAIQNMLTEVLQKFADTVDFITDSGCLLFLLSCRETDGEIPARIRHDTELSAALRTIQQIFWENFHTSFSISVSGIQPFKRIHLARQEVQQALIDRLLLGEGCLITESVHQELANANPDIKNSEVKKILSQIAAGQNSTGAIDSYFSALRKVTPPAAITELKNFLDAFRSTFETLCPELSAPNLLFTAPESFETLDNIREQLNIWIDRVRNARVQRTSRRNQETIQHVKDYIAQNFSDPALGAEQIAEHFGLSSDYLRRLFKEAEGCGISEYLNTVRLNEAKELLLTTNLTANVICERIGIYSSTYFSTLFKKRFGITPILYRQSALDQKEKN